MTHLQNCALPQIECRIPARRQFKLNCCRCWDGFWIPWQISWFQVALRVKSIPECPHFWCCDLSTKSSQGIWSRFSNQFAHIFEENIAVGDSMRFISFSLGLLIFSRFVDVSWHRTNRTGRFQSNDVFHYINKCETCLLYDIAKMWMKRMAIRNNEWKKKRNDLNK